MLSHDLASFVESGISVLVGTRDARLFPDCVRALGVRVERGRRELTVFVPEATGAVAVANLRDNGRTAVCCSRPRDHCSLQLKGRLVSIHAATADDRVYIDRYRAAFSEELAWVGLPPRLTLRMAHWPCHAVRVRIESVFDQTPGPGAGESLSANGAVP